MATQALRTALPIPPSTPARHPAKKPLLVRFFDAIAESQTRRAEREIARYARMYGLKRNIRARNESDR